MGTLVLVPHVIYSTVNGSFWVNVAPLTGWALNSTAQPAVKEQVMKKCRDLDACISLLGEVQAGGDVNPERKQAVERAISEIKRIRRRPNLKKHEVYDSVRTITEALIRAFFDRD
jgi:hypothetical protein